MVRRGCYVPYLPKVIYSTYLLTMWIERRGEYISRYLGTCLSNVHHQAIESTLICTLKRDERGAIVESFSQGRHAR